MERVVSILLIVIAILLIFSLDNYTRLISFQIDDHSMKKGTYEARRDHEYEEVQLQQQMTQIPTNGTKRPSQSGISPFSVIIVTFNEPLLEKTVINILNNTDPEYLLEVLIIDDFSAVPVSWDPSELRVRIIRNSERKGLIGARFIGGNNAKGDFMAFVDAHVFVGPHWLRTPHRMLKEDDKTIVNYLNFNLDKEQFLPKPAGVGVGSCASISLDLRQFWGGGSKTDDFSPITMGMFVISKAWWNKGQMDPDLRIWGGENVEISLRTWLCGGQIRVAKDSFVAHGFRTKFPYPVSGSDVSRNYLRIAHTWLDEEYLELFYKASRIMHSPKNPKDFGDISSRLQLKKELNCKPFSWYAKKFKDRAMCKPKFMRNANETNYRCGSTMTYTPYDLSSLTHRQMFYRDSR